MRFGCIYLQVSPGTPVTQAPPTPNMKSPLAPLAGLGLAAALLLPAQQAPAFSKIGGALGVGQRDVRLFNNFADGVANNNVRGFPDFPFALGAEQAVWKGASEWGTHARSSSGDLSQSQIGNGTANFDPFWQGNSNGVGGTNDNIVSAISSCGGSTLAFTETPISNGWRIRFCDNRTWADGPANIGVNTFDLQGVMAHEYGHALGLGHSTVGGATMWPSIGSGAESERSIEPDDVDGMLCVYGSLSGSRPAVTAVLVDSGAGTVTITGSNFDTGATNEVWFTNRNVTTTGSDPRVRLFNVASTGGGTSITVSIPASAGPGEIMVKNDGGSHTDLSNAFPTDLGEPLFGEVAFHNGLGGNPACFQSTSLPQLGQSFDLQVDASGHPGGAGFSGALIYAGSSSGTVIAAGELLVDLTSTSYGFLIGASSGALDVYSTFPPADPSLLGAQGTVQGFTFSLAQTVLCNAENFTVGAAF